MTDRLWIIGAAFVSGFNANAMCVFVFYGEFVWAALCLVVGVGTLQAAVRFWGERR